MSEDQEMSSEQPSQDSSSVNITLTTSVLHESRFDIEGYYKSSWQPQAAQTQQLQESVVQVMRQQNPETMFKPIISESQKNDLLSDTIILNADASVNAGMSVDHSQHQNWEESMLRPHPQPFSHVQEESKDQEMKSIEPENQSLPLLFKANKQPKHLNPENSLFNQPRPLTQRITIPENISRQSEPNQSFSHYNRDKESPYEMPQPFIDSSRSGASSIFQAQDLISTTSGHNISMSIDQNNSMIAQIDADDRKSEISLSRTHFEILIPYPYQDQIYKKIRENWQKESALGGNQYGNIVYLETGTGKTYIAIMLLKALFFGNVEKQGFQEEQMSSDSINTQTGAKLEPLTNEQISSKQNKRSDLINEKYSTNELKRQFNRENKKAVFIIPTQNLVEQQANTIERYTDLTVGRYHGGQKQRRYYVEFDEWQSEMAQRDVLVMMAKKFYDLLTHGFIKMEQIDLLVIDECHHTDQEHLYNMIMRDFFFHKFQPKGIENNQRRPKILGLTASPIKQKIESKCVLPDDIEKMLQNLSNNLYSRFVTISKEEIQELEKDLKMEIQQFSSNFDENVRTVQKIEEFLLKDLVSSLKLPQEFYKTGLERYAAPIKQVIDFLNQTVIGINEEEQDTQVLNFLNGRKQLIELDCSYSKKEIDISLFKKYEDQLLIILCIIIIKNVNNLLIEIGPIAIKAFVLDLKHDLLETNNQNNKLGEKRDLFVKAIENFCRYVETDEQENESPISNKVQKLVQILEQSYEQSEINEAGKNTLKTIIFVKDRSVAVYLKKILSGNIRDKDLQLIGGKNEDKYNLEQHKEIKGLLDNKKFRIGFAMGPKSKNLVNKAYKSTKLKNSKELEFKSLSSSFPSCRSIKLTKTQLDITLSEFRCGYINILIATNVVEEGLDVSTCNQVICLNELLTVKAFIQMKGRARQATKVSKFIFLCAKEQYTQVREDQESFGRVITFMKQITSREKKELLPEDDIIYQKQLPESDYIYIETTGAKLTARDAKIFIDQFCVMCAPAIQEMGPNSTIQDIENSMSSIQKGNNFSLNLSQLSGSSDQSMEIKEEKHFPYRPNYVVKESVKNQVKYFLCILYMPETCRDKGITKINPKNAYPKKKDAENHVALLAVRRLIEKGYFDEYLFPITSHPLLKNCIGEQRMHKASAENSQQAIVPPKQFNQPQSTQSQSNIMTVYGPRKTKQITEEQKIKQQQDSKHFYSTTKSRLEFEQLPNLLNQQEFKCKVENLYVHTFYCEKEDAYPFKNSCDYIGILFDRQFTNPSQEFQMYQENKQRDKNSAHLNNLFQLNLISKRTQQAIEQPNEALKVSLKREQVFALGIDIDQFIASNPVQKKQLKFLSESNCPVKDLYLAKLAFFHYWLFYYLYSADHKFLKAIFNNKFAFVSYLFSNDLQLIQRKFKVENDRQRFNNNFGKKQGLPQIPLKAYTVPIRKNKGKLSINWALIEKVIEYVKYRLYEVLCHTTERNVILFKYDLEEIIRKPFVFKRNSKQNQPILCSCKAKKTVCKCDFEQIMRQQRAYMTFFLWDQKFQGNRYVILNEETGKDQDGNNVLMRSMDLNQSKQDLEQAKTSLREWHYEYTLSKLENEYQYKHRQNYSQMQSEILNTFSMPFYPNNYLNSSNQSFSEENQSYQNSQLRNKSFLQQSAGRYSKQEYYFLKQGVFQSSMFNKYIVKCRKERHFVDFGKKRKEDEEEEFYKISKNVKSNNNMSGYKANNHKQQDLSSYQIFRKVNTEFDITDSMLSLAPVNYDQYQVLQQTCFHLQNFNEFLMIERFINETFRDRTGGEMYCLLDPHTEVPTEVSTDVFRTIDQIYQRQQEILLKKKNQDVQMKAVNSPFNKARPQQQFFSGKLYLQDNENQILGENDEANYGRDPRETEFKKCVASEQLQKKMHLIREALTSPSACRDYDYERLEFYGDSIAGFLAILELFTMNPTMVEGDLDHERINRVSNERFYKVNKENKFFSYMITDPHHVFSGFVPTGFDNKLKFQEKIVQKSYNEQYNRLQELRGIKSRLSIFLQKDKESGAPDGFSSVFDKQTDPLNFMFLRGDIYILLSMLVKDLEEQKDQSFVYDIIRDDITFSKRSSRDEKILQLHQILINNETNPRDWMLKNIETVIKRVETQVLKLKQTRDQKNKKNNITSKTQKRQLYFKQLADVVESITGAVTIACGLNFTQNFLHKLGVLQQSQDKLKIQMDLLTDQQLRMNHTLEPRFFKQRRMERVEQIINYQFKCKAWLIEALTHKSWIDQSVENSLNLGPNLRIQDYERLEFLGDSILSYLVAKYFFLTTQDDQKRKMPKELHKMKTSIINNCFLSLIVIENEIHQHIIYNEKAAAFKDQVDKCIETVQEMIRECGGTKDFCKQLERKRERELLEESKIYQMEGVEQSYFPDFDGALRGNFEDSQSQDVKDDLYKIDDKEEFKAFDLDILHEHNLKIFGDVFESVIGAVFMDSQSIETTWKVLEHMIMPYIRVYADLQTLQDHPRTKLLELWNQKSYTKVFKCYHANEQEKNGEIIVFKGEIKYQKYKEEVFRETFQKEAKNKIRSFYTKFYKLVKNFIDYVDKKGEEYELQLQGNPNLVVSELKQIRNKMAAEERKNDVTMRDESK